MCRRDDLHIFFVTLQPENRILGFGFQNKKEIYK